jgi:hypothetical protein
LIADVAGGVPVERVLTWREQKRMEAVANNQVIAANPAVSTPLVGRVEMIRGFFLGAGLSVG